MPNSNHQRFDNAISLSSQESLVAEITRHRFVLWRAYALAALGFLVPAVMAVFWLKQDLAGAQFSLSRALVIAALALWALVWVSYVFLIYTDYQLDRWFVTDHRLIDVDQKSLFDRRVSSLHFDDIQDVTVSVSGVVASLVGFGLVRVQTAGTDHEFELKMAANPERARDILLERSLDSN